MNWKDVLKAPLPTNVGQQRDKRHRQSIVDYEKDIIEPKLTNYFDKQPSGTELRFNIKVHDTNVYPNDRFVTTNPPTYNVGLSTVLKLGDNAEFILKVIAEIYEKEGYQVKRTSRNEINIEVKDDGTP
tara:strand:+ start:13120 stop:13503 length:384 start_codon:yes stop_codon:yes gene_type:complete